MILPLALLDAINALQLAGLQCTGDFSEEVEAREYGGFRFTLEGRQVVFRVAKITPTKVGQFVTLWYRPRVDGVIAPLDCTDAIDFVVIHAASEDHAGLFVFDRETLISRGVMSSNGVGGKRALRVYPPWSTPSARQALQTQRWQVGYFVDFAGSDENSARCVRDLFHGISHGFI